MLLPTNDGFVGLDSHPTRINDISNRDVVLYLSSYDAGTEANDELLVIDNGGVPGVPGIPADPGMRNGVGGSGVTEPDANATTLPFTVSAITARDLHFHCRCGSRHKRDRFILLCSRGMRLTRQAPANGWKLQL